MADIKDKNVTVEALAALHEHNEYTYMTQENPTGTGSISINRKVDTDVGDYSATIGYNNTASGDNSYAEGSGTIAEGFCSHTKGYQTVASGMMSSAEGRDTIAAGENQHVQGKYNVEDKSNTYAHIVGNGVDSSTRSNAHTLDWGGNAWFAGDVFVGGTKQTEGTKLVKTTNIASIEYGDTLPAAGNVGRVFFKKVSE